MNKRTVLVIKSKLALAVLAATNACLNSVAGILFHGKNALPENIVVHTSANLGDGICRIPAIWAIRKQYPNARLTLLTTPVHRGQAGLKELLGNAKWLEEIIVYYYEDVNSYKKMRKYFGRLKDKGYDYFINLPYGEWPVHRLVKEMLWARWMGIYGAEGFRRSYTRLFANAQSRVLSFDDEVVRCLKCLPFPASLTPEYPALFTDQQKAAARRLLLEIVGDRRERILAISFAGKGRIKYWPRENFREIARRFTAIGGAVVVVGGKGERDEGEGIVQGLAYCYNLCGMTSIMESFPLLEAAGLVLTIDTGTAHQAALLQIPGVVLMSGKTFPGVWKPHSDRLVQLRRDIDCVAKCRKGCLYGEPSRCMELITVEEAWDALVKAGGLYQ